MVVTGKTILVRNLELRVLIGAHSHEKAAPQRLLVSVEADVEDDADEKDRLTGTLDYDLICDFIRSLQSDPHVELQETVARRTLDFVLSLPGVNSATVETRKPDIFDDCEFVGVKIAGRKPDCQS